VVNADIRAIPLGNDYAECSVLRNILEFLPSYQEALTEAIRLTTKEIIVSFSVFPHVMNGMGDNIKEVEPGLYRNSYSQTNLENFLMSQAKVKSYFWEKLDDHNMMLAILLNQ
jgi:ubiquinone/menaquinone biosynthesis C-methylase UbiE